MTAHHSIFPLTVSEGHISISPEAKDEMFDVFMTQLNAQGNTMDFLGYNRLHLEPDLHHLYTAILSIAHEHFRALNHSRQVKAKMPDSTGDWRARLSRVTCLGSGSNESSAARSVAVTNRTASKS
jgi:hypothetical protein